MSKHKLNKSTFVSTYRLLLWYCFESAVIIRMSVRHVLSLFAKFYSKITTVTHNLSHLVRVARYDRIHSSDYKKTSLFTEHTSVV